MSTIPTDEQRQHWHSSAKALVLAGLVSGLLADQLVWPFPDPGIGTVLWAAGSAVAMAAALRARGRWLDDRFRVLLAAYALVLTVAFMLSDSDMVLAVDGIVAFSCIALAASTAPTSLARTSIPKFAEALFMGALSALVAAMLVIAEKVQWRRLVVPRNTAIRPWVTGTLIAVPIVVIFAMLLASADSAFDSILQDVFSSPDTSLFRHVGVMVLVAWFVVGIGYLRFFDQLGSYSPDEAAPSERVGRIGEVELGIVLGALNLLFALFVAVQVRYLFGGHELVQKRTGLTYADYAHKGFGEILVVAALSLGLLIALDHARHRSARREELLFRGFSLIMLALLAVIMASAVYRLRLYEQAYGMTELRLLAFFVLAWVALVLAWFAIVVLRDLRARFAAGSFVAGMAVVVMFNLVNPTALTARMNIDKAQKRSSSYSPFAYDTNYASSLSADAIPTLIDGLDEMSNDKRKLVAQELLRQWGSDGNPDWREFNVSRYRAYQAVREHRRQIRDAAG